MNKLTDESSRPQTAKLRLPARLSPLNRTAPSGHRLSDGPGDCVKTLPGSSRPAKAFEATRTKASDTRLRLQAEREAHACMQDANRRTLLLLRVTSVSGRAGNQQVQPPRAGADEDEPWGILCLCSSSSSCCDIKGLVLCLGAPRPVGAPQRLSCCRRGEAP